MAGDFKFGQYTDKSLDDSLTETRNRLVSEAIQDPEMDDITRAEFKAYNFREFGTAERAIEAFKAGKGAYGARRANFQIAKVAGDMPGFSQVNIASQGKPVGDTSMAGLPSMMPNVDPVGTASLIADVQRRELKKREKAGV